MIESEPYMTPADAARIARVSAETIRRAIRSGALQSLKRPGSPRHLIERQTFEQWIKGRCATTALPPSITLAELMKQLPDLPAFQGDPVIIQQALRDEWQ